ncbi:DNA-binding NarL/FixJ family response regulator [Paenibacillus phyllosphaerae]|uniref:DNA-binding NarL/FixJ family response regulator n=1 Tax=Paenibacillus phyllosphaerae TaxID=274593 RepID=A0A7W5FKZ0_9BACL|nr:response regulator transcription factor [Paenibacillus phyllosphaerae]MBB3108417.1 DNA-binding NarL/FixJ family response regulator [Paenibacillus phyllosphaerae]
MTIRIIIADDQTLMRDGLQTIVQLEDDMQVVATAENGSEAYELVKLHQPDLVLMDIRMPVMDGIASTRLIRKEFPGTLVLVLTTFAEDDYIVDALAGGACGFLLKDMPGDRLLQAIREAIRGELMMPTAIASKLAERIAMLSGKEPVKKKGSEGRGAALDKTIPIRFTDREKTVIALMMEGMTNREIAGKLFMSEGTVKNYVSTIYDKIGTNDRTQAVLWLKDMTLL